MVRRKLTSELKINQILQALECKVKTSISDSFLHFKSTFYNPDSDRDCKKNRSIKLVLFVPTLQLSTVKQLHEILSLCRETF